MYARDYEALFNSLVQTQVNDACANLADGFDLGTLNENVGFLAGMFTNLLISPFTMDDFMFAGFSFFTDAPSMDLAEQL
jgi:hypothetical protein